MARGKRLRRQKAKQPKALPKSRPKEDGPLRVLAECRPEQFAQRESSIEVWYLGETRWVEVARVGNRVTEECQRQWLGRRSGKEEWRTLYQFISTPDGQEKETLTRVRDL